MDRPNTVGNSSPSHPSRDGRFGDPYARQERSRDAYRGNERESAYRGRGPTYGRRDGEVRGPGDGGSAICGPGRFSTPVDPWDESRAATETWFTVATHTARRASRSDMVLRLNTGRVPTHEDTAAQDTIANLFEDSDPGRTDEIAVAGTSPAVLRASPAMLQASPAMLQASPGGPSGLAGGTSGLARGARAPAGG